MRGRFRSARRALALLAAGAGIAAALGLRGAGESSATPAVRAPQRGAAAPWTVEGRLGGPAPGLVADVALGPRGEVYVLDAAEMEVRVHSAEGTPLRRMGRRGRGPGELVGAVALAADARGRLYVLDESDQRVEVFRGADGVRLGGFRPRFTARDLCILGERLFVFGERGGFLIHEVSPADGRILRSFAPDPQREDPLLSLDRSGGMIECGPGEVVAHLPLLRPEVTRYSAATGRALGTIAIPGYVRVGVRRYGNGVLFQDPERGSSHAAAGLGTLDGGRQLVQIGFVHRGGTRFEMDSIRSFVLDWRTGTAAETPALPRVLAAGARRAYAALVEPEPAVAVLRRVPPAAEAP